MNKCVFKCEYILYFRLRGWYTASGHSETMKSLSRAGGGGGGDFNAPLYTFQEVTEAKLGEKLNVPDTYSVVAMINTIRVENSIYKSCPVEGCKKKVNCVQISFVFHLFLFHLSIICAKIILQYVTLKFFSLQITNPCKLIKFFFCFS